MDKTTAAGESNKMHLGGRKGVVRMKRLIAVEVESKMANVEMVEKFNDGWLR